MVPAAVAVLVLSLASYLYFRRTSKLTNRDTIVLADFINTTGDAVFDDTLRQGLAIQLEQSTFLKIMDDEQVQQDLRLMSIAPASHITNQIAHDISCGLAGVAGGACGGRGGCWLPVARREVGGRGDPGGCRGGEQLCEPPDPRLPCGGAAGAARHRAASGGWAISEGVAGRGTGRECGLPAIRPGIVAGRGCGRMVAGACRMA